jgi:hypothetical protein
MTELKEPIAPVQVPLEGSRVLMQNQKSSANLEGSGVGVALQKQRRLPELAVVCHQHILVTTILPPIQLRDRRSACG